MRLGIIVSLLSGKKTAVCISYVPTIDLLCRSGFSLTLGFATGSVFIQQTSRDHGLRLLAKSSQVRARARAGCAAQNHRRPETPRDALWGTRRRHRHRRYKTAQRHLVSRVSSRDLITPSNGVLGMPATNVRAPSWNAPAAHDDKYEARSLLGQSPGRRPCAENLRIPL